MPEWSDLRREGLNRIEVMMNDGTHHLFSPVVLDVLLESNRVMKFKRKSGWVTVGVDPVRTKSRRLGSFLFDGHERRASH
jgi:hypothetical protein